MNNSKKIPNDMRANLQQKARGLRRNKDAAMPQEHQIPDKKEQEQEYNVPQKIEEIKKVQNKSDQQAEEWDSFVANNSSEEDVIRKKIIDYASQNNVVENDRPLAKGAIVTHKGVKNGQEVATSYEIIDKISSGGFGITYKVILANHVSEKFFVLKEFYPQGAGRNPQDKHININMNDTGIVDALDAFYKEPTRIRELIIQHYTPNSEKGWKSLNLVIPKTDTFESFHNLYYVMDYVEGTPLFDLVSGLPNYNALSLSDRLWVVHELCKAVGNLQSIGCIHQDITPKNVMVNLKGKRVVLIDYGLCTNVIKQGTNASIFKAAGTPGFWDIQNFKTYMDNPSKRGLLHIFSLGAMLAYTCLVREPKKISSNFLLELEPKEELNGKYDSVKCKIVYNQIKDLVSRSIEGDLDKRIQTIEEFKDCLDAIIECNKSAEDKIDAGSFPSKDENERTNSVNEDGLTSSSGTKDALFTMNEVASYQSDGLVSQPIQLLTSTVQEKVEGAEGAGQNCLKEKQEEKERLRREEESLRREAEKKNAEEEEQKRQKERLEADNKLKEDPKGRNPKYVTGILVGGLLTLLLVWGWNEWNNRLTLSDAGTGTSTTTVADSPENLLEEKVIPDTGTDDKWMENPLANLEKLKNDQMMAVLERAQQDLDFRHQLEHHYHRDLTILQLDPNGVPFKTTMLQLFMNNELGKEYEVSETEIVDNKLKRIILTKK